MRSRYIQNDLLAFLQDGKLHKIADICFELEISRSTCIRHINDLSKHYNIQTFVGKHNGGVQLINKKKLDVDYLKNDDLQLITAWTDRAFLVNLSPPFIRGSDG